MDAFKAQSFLEADPPRLGRLDEAKILYKENALLKDRLNSDALQFARKRVRNRVSKVGRQCGSADGRPIVELHLVRLARSSNLPPSLQISNGIDEPRMRPWCGDTLRLFYGDDSGSCFFDHAEAVNLQLTNYGCLPRAGRSGQYESFHLVRSISVEVLFERYLHAPKLRKRHSPFVPRQSRHRYHERFWPRSLGLRRRQSPSERDSCALAGRKHALRRTVAK